uniref:Uncharacterized protein n=1 Tax=Mycobacterium leprae TaxID=1769 RepID=O33134_MYCLR|nr:hypothetical protein MLCL536.10 [Mycobacterium leprae]
MKAVGTRSTSTGATADSTGPRWHTGVKHGPEHIGPPLAAPNRRHQHRRAGKQTQMNLPLACRQATITTTETSPTPNRASSCCTVAVLWSSISFAFYMTDPDDSPDSSGVAEPEIIKLLSTLGCPKRDQPNNDLPSVAQRTSHVQPDGVRTAHRLCPASTIHTSGTSMTSPEVCTRPTTLNHHRPIRTSWLSGTRTCERSRGYRHNLFYRGASLTSPMQAGPASR